MKIFESDLRPATALCQDFGITYTHGLVVAVSYIAVAAAAASVTFARRDVTA